MLIYIVLSQYNDCYVPEFVFSTVIMDLARGIRVLGASVASRLEVAGVGGRPAEGGSQRKGRDTVQGRGQRRPSIFAHPWVLTLVGEEGEAWVA